MRPDLAAGELAGVATPPPGAAYALCLPVLTPAPNAVMRMHWSERRRYINGLAWQMRAAFLGPLPVAPIARSRVKVWRHAIQALDVDALAASAKFLLDILQPPSARHPYGLGVIANDRADCCDLVVRWVPVKHRPDQRTVIEISDLRGE